MESIIHADIFFFITSIAVGIFAVGMIVVMFFVIRILNDMKHISKKMSEESDRIAEDIDLFRETAKAEGLRVKTIFNFFLDKFFGKFTSGLNKKNEKHEKNKI